MILKGFFGAKLGARRCQICYELILKGFFDAKEEKIMTAEPKSAVLARMLNEALKQPGRGLSRLGLVAAPTPAPVPAEPAPVVEACAPSTAEIIPMPAPVPVEKPKQFTTELTPDLMGALKGSYEVCVDFETTSLSPYI
ncbi:MAG: hypothetical protein K0041_08630, partial [Acidithiobacillus sp.]|nr:hypothetical protein [Acidithiobacillus sp.]